MTPAHSTRSLKIWHTHVPHQKRTHRGTLSRRRAGDGTHDFDDAGFKSRRVSRYLHDLPTIVCACGVMWQHLHARRVRTLDFFIYFIIEPDHRFLITSKYIRP